MWKENIKSLIGLITCPIIIKIMPTPFRPSKYKSLWITLFEIIFIVIVC